MTMTTNMKTTMVTNKVFLIATSLEVDRPNIDYTLNQKTVDWRRIGRIVDGDLPLAEYVPPHIIIPQDDALSWDYYSCSGTHGFLSSKAAEVLDPHTKICFELLDAFVNEEKYYLMRCIATFPYLDREKSMCVPFPDGSGQIMEIEKYVFLKHQIPDPSIFVIPEDWSRIYGTDGIARQVESLKGLRSVDVEEHGVIPAQ